jgi:hypothetical protein
MLVSPSGLPASAKLKLANLRAAATEAQSMAQSVRAGVVGKQKHLDQAAYMLRANQNTFDAATKKAYADEIALLQADIQNSLAKARKLDEAADPAKNLLTRVETWLEHRADFKFETVDSKVSKSDLRSPRGALERIREEIALNHRTLSQGRRAMPPRDELKKEARAYVERLANGHKPYIGRMDRNLETAKSSIEPLHFDLVNPDASVIGVPNLTSGRLVAFMAWLDPEKMIARLDKEIDERFTDKGAVSTAHRRRLEIETPDTVLRLERMEEGLVEHLLAAGETVERRADADPRAVLGVEATKPSAVAKLVTALIGNKADLDHPELAEDEAA